MKRSLHSAVPPALSLIVLAAASSAKTSAEEQDGMILVSAGRGTVGTSESERAEVAKRFDCHPTWLGDDLPRHEGALAAFWIDRYPVTNAQYLAFVEAPGQPRPDWWGRWGGVFPMEYADHPVAGVSGKDAAVYAKWAGKRLATAEEWEAAVGGPNRSTFAWGEDWPEPLRLPRLDRIYWELPSSPRRPVPVDERGERLLDVHKHAFHVPAHRLVDRGPRSWAGDDTASPLVPGGRA
jgi:formylglycine-generating enzyme required for sulfatase activity